MTDIVLRVRDLSVGFGDVVALDSVSIDVERGLLTALVGPSGCGKTTFLRAVAGLQAADRGVIEIDGVQMNGPRSWVPPEHRQVGMVFQEGALFPHLSVWDNVLYGVKARLDGHDLAAEALRVVGLEGFDRRYPDELSGGQQQRVALARALAPSPRMVLLDEPFANLDAGLRVRVRAEVRSILQRTATTAILVTHDQEEALSVADRVVVMDEGRILQTGTPAEVYGQPDSLAVARFFGEGQLLRCRIGEDRLHSVFGSVESVARPAAWRASLAADEDGWLWARPEDFHLSRANAASAGATQGRVVTEKFFGHDLLQEVELESGGAVWVRSLSSDRLQIGDSVAVALRQQPFPVFSDAEIAD